MPELADIDDTVVVAGIGVGDADSGERAAGAELEVLDHADQIFGHLRRRLGTGPGAAEGKRSRDGGEVLGVLPGCDRQQNRVALLGKRRVARGHDHALDHVVGHPSMDVLERDFALEGFVQGGVALPHHRRPYLARVVDLRVGEAIWIERGSVGEWLAGLDVAETQCILLGVGRVGHAAIPEKARFIGKERTVVGKPIGAVEVVTLAQRHVQPHEITPTFALPTALDRTDLDQPVVYVVTIFVGDDQVIDRPVALDLVFPHHRCRLGFVFHRRFDRDSGVVGNPEARDPGIGRIVVGA